ncbi:hypothetical protein [Castellaniella caeni]|uniref:hypothetical protein n=1 Tax=Castellaniella caeni TaxID=266123 RepID=UPI000C9FBC42|nr:hypothetical protein [Castellaniella caeni]
MMNEHDRDQTLYALARQVPDMDRGFQIHTNYGEIEIAAEEAALITQVVRQVLSCRLDRVSESALTAEVIRRLFSADAECLSAKELRASLLHCRDASEPLVRPDSFVRGSSGLAFKF